MTDIVCPEKRKQMMSGIRGKNTRPEILLRKWLHASGFRFRIHVKNLPGNPDIVFPKYNALIFVHGCFWHRHDCHLFKWPSTRIDFWQNKINGNVKNDFIAQKNLETLGWRYLIVWECALKGKRKWDDAKLINKITTWIRSTESAFEIAGS